MISQFHRNTVIYLAKIYKHRITDKRTQWSRPIRWWFGNSGVNTHAIWVRSRGRVKFEIWQKFHLYQSYFTRRNWCYLDLILKNYAHHLSIPGVQRINKKMSIYFALEMATSMHFIQTPKSYILDEGTMLTFVSEKIGHQFCRSVYLQHTFVTQNIMQLLW